MPLGVKFLLGSFIILILGGVWVGIHKEWRTQKDVRIVFRLPLSHRLLLGGSGLWLVFVPLLLLIGKGADKVPLFVFLFIELVSCLVGGLLFCAAGLRCELSLDTQQRTYRFTSGWGLRPRVYFGSFEDFGGVFVRSPTGGSKSEQYSAGLVWKSVRRRSPRLGTSGEKQDMDALAAEMVALGLPLVAAPAPETIRELLRRGSTR